MSSKAPIKYYEIVDKKNSGFIMDGTLGTAYQQELTGPSIEWLPNSGKTAVIENGVKSFREIRYLAGCDIIDPKLQAERGFVPRKFEDKIGLENGFMTVAREGDAVGLYDYMEKSFYNLDNPDRPVTADARYREVKLDKKAEFLLDEDELQTQAKAIVYSLRISQDGKGQKYKYNTDKIDAICRLVNVWDETPERKLILLIQKALQSPKDFISLVAKSEQTVITEVSHALEMSILKIQGNTISYTDSNKNVHTVEGDKLKEDQKIELFANWLSTSEGTTSLTELRSKLELAKSKLV